MGYSGPILWAFLVFPFVSFLFTIPYVLIQYHKYGSIPTLRVVIVYSFILYLLCAYFLVILPLPTVEEVAQMTGARTQLIPFQFVVDFMRNTSLVIQDPSTYLIALKEPYVYQVGYNILLFLPFGVYLRYYFKCSFKKTVLFSFLLSLFFELTQLTGLYGIYPRGYRLFDVDDLMLNTLGGIVGFVVALLVLKNLPNRDKLDHYAYRLGKDISLGRRLVNLWLDWILVIFVIGLVGVIGSYFHLGSYGWISFGVIVIYFIVIPIILGGQTLGKKFLKMKLVTLDHKKPKFYHYIGRYLILYGVFLVVPFYGFLLLYLIQLLPIHETGKSLVMINFCMFTVGVFLVYYVYQLIMLGKKKLLWYEKISHTMNVSTIIVPKSVDLSEDTNDIDDKNGDLDNNDLEK